MLSWVVNTPWLKWSRAVNITIPTLSPTHCQPQKMCRKMVSARLVNMCTSRLEIICLCWLRGPDKQKQISFKVWIISYQYDLTSVLSTNNNISVFGCHYYVVKMVSSGEDYNIYSFSYSLPGTEDVLEYISQVFKCYIYLSVSFNICFLCSKQLSLQLPTTYI